MATINQLLRNKRVTKKVNLNKTPALFKSPQKYGTCLSIFTKTPRKPNSALRKVAKVRLANSKIINIFIPGEGHNISRFSDVLVVGRRIRDLPGIKYGALRGKLDLSGVLKKRQARSKYGSKREKKNAESKLKRSRNKTVMSCTQKKVYKSLKNMLASFLQTKDIKSGSKVLSHLNKVSAYNFVQRIRTLKSKKKYTLERNLQLILNAKTKTFKKKKIKEAWVETKHLISGIKKSISKKENLRRLNTASTSEKQVEILPVKPLSTGNSFTLLEVSQTLRIIRVSDLRNNRVIRYHF